MATIINNPSDRSDRVDDSGSGAGLIVGIIFGIIIIALFFMYALPAIRNNSATTNQPNPNSVDVNVQLPGGGNNSGGATDSTSGNTTSGNSTNGTQ